jgi:potassium efflux system protein
VLAGTIIGLDLLGVRWSQLQWMAAALTVGLGFGLQEIFANFVSGLIILIERPIRVGDTVTVGGVSGIVTRIRIRATAVTDWNRKELIVPNKRFITEDVINWTLSDPLTRLDIPVGIAYGSDTALALKLLHDATLDVPGVLDSPEAEVFFVGFGDNSLNFEVRVYARELSNKGRTKVVHGVHLAVDRLFREHDVVIAFPQRDLHLKSSDVPITVVMQQPDGTVMPLGPTGGPTGDAPGGAPKPREPRAE